MSNRIILGGVIAAFCIALLAIGGFFTKEGVVKNATRDPLTTGQGTSQAAPEMSTKRTEPATPGVPTK